MYILFCDTMRNQIAACGKHLEAILFLARKLIFTQFFPGGVEKSIWNLREGFLRFEVK